MYIRAMDANVLPARCNTNTGIIPWLPESSKHFVRYIS